MGEQNCSFLNSLSEIDFTQIIIIKNQKGVYVNMTVKNISNICPYGILQSMQNKLSDETKRKLESLGIDPSTVTSESQAQILIAAAVQKVSQTTNESSSQMTCTTSETELIARAKTLASKINISTSGSDSLENLIDKITSKLESLSAQIEGNDTSKINDYENELTSIKNEYSQISESQNTLISAMNITANMNKLMMSIR